MNVPKALLLATSGLVGACLIYSTTSIHQDSAKLAIETATLRGLSNELARLQEEVIQLAPIRKALAVEAELRQERESRKKDLAEIATLEKRITDYHRKQEAGLERIKQELNAVKQKSLRGEPVAPANAFKTEALELKLDLSNARNQGATSPETLLETWLWTVQNGASEERRKLQFIPEDATPELLAAWQKMDIAAAEHRMLLNDVTSVILTERSLTGDGMEASLRAKLVRRRDPIKPETSSIKIFLIRSGNEWKVQSIGGMD